MVDYTDPDEAPLPTPIDDAKRAKRIRDALTELRAAIKDAQDAGLRVRPPPHFDRWCVIDTNQANPYEWVIARPL